MASLQQAPEPAQQAAQYIYSTSGSGGSGENPPADRIGALEIGLANDGRMKSALHRLALVLPLTLLIFEQALRQPALEIELPILKLKVTLQSILPIFLMLISYMLYRAQRYARIVLWSIVYLPRNMERVGQIVLDNSDAFKINSAYYEEVVDPMAAALLVRWKNLRSQWTRAISWYAAVGFNLAVALVVYSIIFLILTIMAAYVSQQWLALLPPLKLADFRPPWQFVSTKAIELLVFGISALLLLLAWSNAVSTIAVALWTIARCLLLVFVRMIVLISGTFAFAPVRPLFRGMFVTGTWIREKRRDSSLAKQNSAYMRRKYKFLKESPSAADFKIRLELDRHLRNLTIRLGKIRVNFGRKVLRGRGQYEENTEWSKTIDQYGFTSLSLCISALQVLAQLAPADFLADDWQQFYARLNELLDAYEVSPPDSFVKLMKEQTITPTEREQAAETIRKWLESVPSKKNEISALREECDRKLSSIVSPKDGRYVYFDIYKLKEVAGKYFAQSEMEVAEFTEQPPVRGARDWTIVSYLLDIFRRAARLPEPT
jgi:hypothetical protein